MKTNAMVSVHSSRVCLSALIGLLLASRLANAQTPDAFNPGADGSVYATTEHLDGLILVGGDFITIGGQTRSRIARFVADGTLDSGFNPSANGTVRCLAVQADGKILVGGAFTSLSGQPRQYLGRLNADGTLDFSFNPGANDTVGSVVVQADGKILVGGTFGFLGGQPRNRIGRLNADGTLDASFNPGANDYVQSLAVQADGKILVGGWFTTLAGQSRNYLGRLNADGTLDTGFNPGANSVVYSLAEQADRKVLVGGLFSTLAGQSRNRIGRLDPDGALDPNFNPSANDAVQTLVLQADGRILMGGWFSTVAGSTRNRIARLNADGVLDPTFNPGASGVVYSLAVQTDGKVLAGGAFSTLGGFSRGRLGRLNNTEPATQALTIAEAAITWLRGGTAPEVGRVTFEYWTNGTTWAGPIRAERIPGGWQLAGVDLPTNSTLRARGSVSGGYVNGSGWFVETTAGPVQIASQPVSRTNLAGNVAGFSVAAVGSGPLSYQWRKAGVNLIDGVNVSGAASPRLTLGSILGGDTGGYSVVVSNAFGSVTSSITFLSVVDPVITFEPYDQTANWGETVFLDVGAAGTTPLHFQWRKDGAILSGATNATLTLAELQVTNAGGYDVVVSNVFGSLTSSVAIVTVVDPALLEPPQDLAVSPGQFAQFSVTALGTPPLSYQWRKDGAILNGATDPALVLMNAQGSDAGYYEVAVSNQFGNHTSAVAVLTVNLVAPDPFNPYVDDDVFALAVQGDRELLVGGRFDTIRGQPRERLGRLDPDGSLDSAFYPASLIEDPEFWEFENEAAAFALAVQADGKIVAGGQLTIGYQAYYLGRFNADGSLDTGFNVATVLDNSPDRPAAFCAVVQADGKVLVGGRFNLLAGLGRTNLGRLHPDGTLDLSFNTGASLEEPFAFDGIVNALAVQTDGKILVGGVFTRLGGQSRTNLGRLNSDGSLDFGFNPGAGYEEPFAFGGGVYAIVVQADGKILVGGEFAVLGGQNRFNLGRLNPDGTLDTDFNPAVWSGLGMPGGGGEAFGQRRAAAAGGPGSLPFNGSVYALAAQANGKILVGGYFDVLNGQSRMNLGRLNADGSLDLTYNPGADFQEPFGFDGVVGTIALQADGKILVGGSFDTLGGQPRANLGRLNNTDAATEILTYDGSAITWLRGGGSPEVWRTSFEASSDGTNWLSLGAGSRIAGGWEQPGVSLPVNSVVRARGFAGGGFVETVIHPPLITTQPVSQFVAPGENVTFSVSSSGMSPLSYQWRHDGVAIPGATNRILTLMNVQSQDDSFYSVAVINALGTAVSSNAVLTVTPALATALDTPSLTWTSGGSAPWFGQYHITHDGVDAAQSGSIPHGQHSWVETTVVGPGTLHFWWRVSSESDYDFLEFRANGTLVDFISGEIPWQQRTLSLGQGAQVLRWRYTKDSSLNGGKDLAWLDQVSFTPAQSPAVTADYGSLGFISNRFGFKISGAAGQVVVVEGSTNLSIWTPLVTNTMGAGPFSFMDPGATDFQRRFYRMRLQ